MSKHSIIFYCLHTGGYTQSGVDLVEEIRKWLWIRDE